MLVFYTVIMLAFFTDFSVARATLTGLRRQKAPRLLCQLAIAPNLGEEL